MKYAVIIQADAERDVDEAYTWLAEQSPDAAGKKKGAGYFMFNG